MLKLRNHPARSLFAVLAVLFLFAAGLPSLQRHHHGPNQRADRCPECLALASATSAVVAVNLSILDPTELLQCLGERPYTFVLASVPLDTLCRGPPAESVT